MKAYDIQWDVDLEEDWSYKELIKELGLPEEVEIPEGLDDADEIGEYLSDLTGFCHYGFKIKE